jgi:Flp pilus assembly protein TadG
MDHHRRMVSERGAALVELAMVVPLLMALMLGIFTGGDAFFQKISLVDATREGARYGASLKMPAGGVTAWRQAVQDRVVQLSGGQAAAADVCVDLVVPTGTNNSCGVNDPTGASTDPTALTPASVVKVSVVKTTELEFVFFSSNATLSAKVAARYERDIL